VDGVYFQRPRRQVVFPAPPQVDPRWQSQTWCPDMVANAYITGTGKSVTASNMGRVYYDMGILSTKDVIECSASDLIAEFVGQTGPKTQKQLEKGLGKTLFIDDAYRLKEGQYATEAVEEMVYLLSTPRFMGKMVVILAGYAKHMDELMLARPNLSSYFQQEIEFQTISPEDSLIILQRELGTRRVHAPFLSDPKSGTGLRISRAFAAFGQFPSWGNARDINNLSKQMIAMVLIKNTGDLVDSGTKGHRDTGPSTQLVISEDQALMCIRNTFRVYYQRFNPPNTQSQRSDNSADSVVTKLEKVAERLAEEMSPEKCVNVERHSGIVRNYSRETSTEQLTRGVGGIPGGSARAPPARPNIPKIAVQEATQHHIVDERSRSKIQERGDQGIDDASDADDSDEEESMEQLLARLGPCPEGFAWMAYAGGYRCRGEGHTLSIEEARSLVAASKA